MTEPAARRRRLTRRRLLCGLGAGAAGAAGLRWGIPRWTRPGPIVPVEELSDPARELVRRSFQGVERALLWDLHAHLVGLDSGRNGTWVHPDMQSWRHPWRKLQFDVYLSAAGASGQGAADVDRVYVERLFALHRAMNPEGKLVLLAFDERVEPDGTVDRAGSSFHTPDAYALRLAAEHDDVLACISVHPSRPDALARLEAGRAAGAVLVKWLPNAMGIDPSAKEHEPFYARLRELGLVLLSHTGNEKAVHAEEDQALGNPLLLRRPLDAGVRVIAAHCATYGTDVDLDRPGAVRVPSFELFLRLMGEGTEGRLFGGLSAVTLVNREPDVLRQLLSATELHPRLVNGSDYPLPAIDYLVSPWLLARRGLLEPSEVTPLREIFRANPLLFDFVLKRRLRLETGAGPVRFAASAFETGRLFRA